MATPRKLGVLVAIPIKGRKLLNRSRGKQSPYIQLKLGSELKRTKTSLIASEEPEWDQEIRLDVFQGALNMHVVVLDEGKKNEVIGSDVLLLHEVLDKGELDVWFPIKHNGKYAGEIYFELTFYALAQPLPSGQVPAPPMQMQHPPIRHIQSGYAPGGRPLPYIPSNPPAPMYTNAPRPPAPFPVSTYQHPVGYGHSPSPRPYPIPQQHPYPPLQAPTTSLAYGGPPNGSVYNPPGAGTPPFKLNAQGGHPNQILQPHPSSSAGFGGFQSNPPGRFPVPQHPPPPGGLPQRAPGPASRPPLQPTNSGHGHHVNGRPTNFTNINQHHRRPPGSLPVALVTPPIQYNYNISSFP